MIDCVQKALSNALDQEIREKLAAYYTAYYRDALGLPDWPQRIANRMQEELTFAEPAVRKIESWLDYSFREKQVLVVGTGTGAEVVVLGQRGAFVRGIEPNSQALEVAQLKARRFGMDDQVLQQAVAERIPFPNEVFDFIYCHTVLEHVQDVGRSIDEMIRVTKPGGTIYLQTPDYRFPYEGHYKMTLIPFAPRWIQRIYLHVRGRPTRFINSVTFLTTPMLDRLLWIRPVTAIRVFEPQVLLFRRFGQRFFAWFGGTFAIPSQQNIFLRKRIVESDR